MESCFRGLKDAPDIIGTDGQLPVTPINQHCQFDPAGSSEIQQGIEGSPDRPSCKKDIVHQKHVLVFDGKANLRLFHLRGLAQSGPIIPIKSNVDDSRREGRFPLSGESSLSIVRPERHPRFESLPEPDRIQLRMPVEQLLADSIQRGFDLFFGLNDLF